MTQAERQTFLIQKLLDEQQRYKDIEIPQDTAEQKRLLRSLLNVRSPKTISNDFLSVQDEYLREEAAVKGVTDLADLSPISDGLYLWQGDITTLRCDAIVNAANSGMMGCYAPCHGCIDNCIHTYAGVQLRLECARLMMEQARGFPPRQDLPIRENASAGILQILKISTVFTICIQVGFAVMTRRRNIGLIGAVLLRLSIHSGR